MKPKFVAIGEAMLEVAPANTGYGIGYAGDTLNTAWYLKKLQPDWSIDYLTRVGTDNISDQFVEFLIEAEIEAHAVLRHSGRSMGLYLVQLDAGERSFQYWRNNSAARELLIDPSDVAPLCDAGDILFFSGITLAILDDAQRGALFEILAKARSHGAKVVFDPNLRPRLWPDTDTMCRTIMQAAAHCDTALPSYEDEATYFADADPAATCARYVKAGCHTVVAKNGPNSVAYCHNQSSGSVAPVHVETVLDTTAAGDSFNAGFLASFLEFGDIEAAIVAASQLASRVIQGAGALVPEAILPTPNK